MKRILPIAALAALFAGCVTKHSGIDGRTADWRVGKTARAEVVREWGNPYSIFDDVWIWRDWRSIGSKVKASYFSIGMTISSTRVSTCEYRLEFDEKGVLKDMSVVESIPGGAKWTLNPFD